jgi:hypothetical protein
MNASKPASKKQKTFVKASPSSSAVPNTNGDAKASPSSSAVPNTNGDANDGQLS